MLCKHTLKNKQLQQWKCIIWSFEHLQLFITNLYIRKGLGFEGSYEKKKEGGQK